MAKRRNPSDNQATSSKGRVRVLYVEMDADNVTLRDSVQSLVEAMQHRPIVVQAPLQPNSLIGGDSLRSSNGEELDNPTIDPLPIVDEVMDDDTSAPTNKPKKVRPSYTSVHFDVPEGKLDLAEYIATYKPSNQMTKTLVCVGWWRDSISVDKITPEHIYTCFKDMKWTDTPPDFRATLADLQRKKEFLTKGDRGEWSLNNLGERELTRMMKTASESDNTK